MVPMANEPNGNSGDDVVHGKDLLTRGLDAFFGKLGDMIHGATQKDEAKEESHQATDDTSANGKASDAPIEAEGEEVPARKSEAPPQVA